MELLFQSESVNLSEIKEHPLDSLCDNGNSENIDFATHPGSTSGGYAYHLFVSAAKELFSENIEDVKFKAVRYVL